MLHAPLQACLVDVDEQADTLVHRHGQRLGATHATGTSGEGQRAGKGAVEALVGHGGEGLMGALEDALGADVDPRAGRHLAVHRQAQVLEPAELRPGRPVANKVAVGQDHAWRPLMGAHDADGPAGLDQHGLVLLQRGQGADHRVERLPVACGLARAAVDDQVVGALGVLGVEVVHQHPQRGLGRPRLGGQGRAAGCADGACTFHDESPCSV